MLTLTILYKADNHMALLNPGFFSPAVSVFTSKSCIISCIRLELLSWLRLWLFLIPVFSFFSRSPCVSPLPCFLLCVEVGAASRHCTPAQSPHLLPIISFPSALKPWSLLHPLSDCSASHKWHYALGGYPYVSCYSSRFSYILFSCV